MITDRRCIFLITLCCLLNVCATAQTLWNEPKPTTVHDWIWGPGGAETAPQSPFQFVKESTEGTNPKVEVRDAAGRTWIVKFGAEVHADTFAPRLLNALGYAATPTFYVAGGSISGAQGLKRAKHFIARDGQFHNARFKLHEQKPRHGEHEAENTAWSWVENPFVGSRELGGLKILMMLTSNWDAKDARDGEGGSNTGMVRVDSAANSSLWYGVTDWGASFGKAGGYFGRDRWDWNGYRTQSSRFVRLSPGGDLTWGFKGKHGADITRTVGVEDVRWIVPYLARITDQDLEAGLAASGASTPVAQHFTRSIRARIVQLQRIADSVNIKEAAK